MSLFQGLARVFLGERNIEVPVYGSVEKMLTSFSSTEVRSGGHASLRTSGESSLTTASRSAAVGGIDCGQDGTGEWE